MFCKKEKKYISLKKVFGKIMGILHIISYIRKKLLNTLNHVIKPIRADGR